MSISCSICTESLTDQSNGLVVTHCGHIYHRICLSEWLKSAKTCPQCRSECSSATIRNVYLNNSASTSRKNGETLPLLLGKKFDDFKRQLEDNFSKLNTANQSIREPPPITRAGKFRKHLLVFLTAFGFTVLILYMVFLHYSFDGAVGQNGYEKYAHEAIEAIDHLEDKLNNFSGKIENEAQHLVGQVEENKRLLQNFTDKMENEAQHLAGQVDENKRLLQNFSNKIENEAQHLTEQVEENKRLLQLISQKISSSGTSSTSKFTFIMLCYVTTVLCYGNW